MTAFDQTRFEHLSRLLDTYGEDATAMTVEQAQGFLLACVSGPDHTDRAFWLPELLGDDPFGEAERTEIAGLAAGLAEQMRRQMADGLEPALFVPDDDQGRPDYSSLCSGYLYALDTLPTDWFADRNDEDFEDLLLPVMALGGIYEENELVLSDSELAELTRELPATLTTVYRYWQAVLNKPQTVRRTQPKTGRNDPCPCGSGKKHKACCGKNA